MPGAGPESGTGFAGKSRRLYGVVGSLFLFVHILEALVCTVSL